MAHASSEIQDDSPKNESTGSETPTRTLLYGHTSSDDSDLRLMIEENAFQALSERFLINRPHYTFCVSEPDEDNDFLSLIFPKKLWKIVESDQLKSIWWDVNGTSVVINEELFKKEVLERKAAFQIFETESMKSLVRQLNLYGFSKIRQNCQRSASLADFLGEEKEASALSKLLFYHNPNFKRGYPQLLTRMKRRVGIKNASPASASLLQDFNRKHFRAGSNVGNQNSGLTAAGSGESLFSTPTNVNVPLIRKPSTSQITANTAAPIRSVFLPPSLTPPGPSEQMVTNQYAISNQLTTFHPPSHSSYTDSTGHFVNFVTTPTTSTSQYHIISPIGNSDFGLRVETSTGYPDLSTNEAPSDLLVGNPCLLKSMTADRSDSSLSRLTHQPSTLHQHHPNYN